MVRHRLIGHLTKERCGQMTSRLVTKRWWEEMRGSNQELRLKELPRPRERRKGGSAVNW